MATDYTPAEWVVEQFGGINATARAIDVSPGTVQYWLDDQQDGLIGAKFHKKILQIARADGLDIKLADLVYGRRVNGG